MKPTRKIIIAIDGHASTGKSTVAKEIARLIGIGYVDTGAMYRSVTLCALRNTPSDLSEKAVAALLPNIEISFGWDAERGRNTTYLNGENVEDQIRSAEVSNLVSSISAMPAVRSSLTAMQQQIGMRSSVVMDGRDIGTTVFPNADLKIFMTASADIRARRRYDEMIAKGQQVSFEDTLRNVVERDHLDETRAVSPLLRADDAVLLDNSHMTRPEQTQFIIDLLIERGLVC